MHDELHKFQSYVIAMVTGNKARPWFSICEITEAARILGIKDYADRPTYKLLSRMHCHDYAEMSPDFKAMIPQMIREVLTPKPAAPRRLLMWMKRKVLSIFKGESHERK